MIQISLTEFVDFVAKSGTPKLTVVRTVKDRHAVGYDPKTDFYKPLRDGIVSLHKAGQPKTALDSLTNSLTDQKKITAYPDLVKGYKKFLGNKAVKWFKPPQSQWTFQGLAVSVNPEVGLEINGTRHAIKLYFKADKLSKLRVDAINELMHQVLGGGKVNPTFSILDIRNAKLLSAPAPNPSLLPLLQGEAIAFATIYRQV